MSLKDFLDLLKIKEDKFGELRLKDTLRAVYNFSEEIWKNVQLLNFPDHGLPHSLRVLTQALNIAEKIIPKGEHSLSDLEKMILGAAALIHDIGMQYHKYYPTKKISEDKIRGKHCELGVQMLSDALNNKGRNGLPQLSIQKELKHFIGDFASHVAFSHCSKEKIANEYWDDFKKKNYNADAKEGGVSRRLKLLAGLLRFGDELDMTWLRLKNIEKLDSSLLKVENKAHWACCYYTKNIKVEAGGGGTGGLRIHLSWRAPNKKEEIELIRKLLQDIRLQHFNNEIGIICPYLVWKEGIPQPVIAPIEMDPNPEKLNFVKPLPKDLKEYIQKRVEPYTYGTNTLKRTKNLIELSGNDFDEAKQKADEFVRLRKGVIDAHYVLKTKWHTNQYIKCRELVSDNDFSKTLVRGLANMFKDAKLTRIIAQGTSAIRIGSLLSIVLGTKFSYVSGNAKFQFEEPMYKGYSEFERIATVSKGDKILIIDDILGVGVVFNYLFRELQKLGFKKDNLLFFYIYSLGSKKRYVKDIKDVPVYYLKAFPDIKYWKEDKNGECKICKGKKEMRNYE